MQRWPVDRQKSNEWLCRSLNRPALLWLNLSGPGYWKLSTAISFGPAGTEHGAEPGLCGAVNRTDN